MESYGLFVAALVGLTAVAKAAEWFVDSSWALADSLRMPHATFGATVVALVAFAPEAAVAVQAARLGRLDLAVGHAFSSTSANLCLAVAAVAATSGFRGSGRQAARHLLAVASAAAVAWALASGEGLTRPRSLLLFLACGLTLVYSFRPAAWSRPIRRDALHPVVRGVRGPLPLRFGFAVSMVAVGAWALARAAGPRLTSPATGFASPVMIAAAVCSALPEAAVAVTAGLRQAPDLALGVVTGASILNLTAVTGLAGLIAPGALPPVAWGVQAPLVTAIALALALFCMLRGGIRRGGAVALVTLFLAYLGLLLR